MPKADRLSGPGQFLQLSRQEPALSGNGEKLALIVDQNGRPTVQIRDVRTGKIFPLRHLARYQPHSSPSLSWNGRYLAVITQRGNRRLAIIEDRLTGNIHYLSTRRKFDPIRLSLAPDASQLALQIADNGKWKIQLFDLTKTLELDQMSGLGRSILAD